jgi:hypothetical protein
MDDLVGFSKGEFFIQPMSKNLSTFLQTRLINSYNDGRVAVPCVMDVHWIFVPSEIVERLDHAKLVWCQGKSWNSMLFRFGFLRT